jgi:predicted glycogen debranching enzyme
MISVDRSICINAVEATSREWLETNGLGGLACGTISGVLTRRYHGLLTSAAEPPGRRTTLISKFEEELITERGNFELSANEYRGAIHPRGFEHIVSFRLDPFPVWTFEAGGFVLEKTIFMPHGEDAVVCIYRLVSALDERAAPSLAIRPLAAFKEFHTITRAEAVGLEMDIVPQALARIRDREGREAVFRHNAESVNATGFWYRDFELAVERERGFDHIEDLYQPFELVFDLSAPAEVVISGSSLPDAAAGELEAAERGRRASLIAEAGDRGGLLERLTLAADQFIVRRGSGHSIIAGYPWFEDWGRDTMIALRGLVIAAKRFDIARNILLEYARHFSEGMLPNRFPDAGDDPAYNTVDATLWYFEAVRSYVSASGDADIVRDNLYDLLSDSIAWHLKGTRSDIAIDTDGLLTAGGDETQLTWMDAKADGHVFTPRGGKPVEVQALWYNALMAMAGFADELGFDRDKRRYEAMAELCCLSFNALFWNETENCLFDVVKNGRRDGSVRPNQIFAVSLHHTMLDAERSAAVVSKVESELLTPFGLRTLSPRDAAYQPVYEGGPFERDSAYHQGTVWPWLAGAFFDAYARVFGGPGADALLKPWLSEFAAHLEKACLGQVSEIFDAELPQRPRGCFAQAWSVGELLHLAKKLEGERSVLK